MRKGYPIYWVSEMLSKIYMLNMQLWNMVFALLDFIAWSNLPSLCTHSSLLEWEGTFCAFICWKDITCVLIVQDVAIMSVRRGDGEMAQLLRALSACSYRGPEFKSQQSHGGSVLEAGLRLT